MRAVHDDRRSDTEHIGNVAEIDHQVVVAVHIATFGKPNLTGTGLLRLFLRVSHIFTRKELRFLDIDRTSRTGRSDQQIGLAAKKRRKQREAKRRKLLRQQKRMQQPTKKKVVKLLRSIDWSLIPVIGKWIFQIALTILIAFVCVWYFGQRVSVVGDSMKPVLENGDIVLANRIVYNASKPKRGDVIIFKPKGNENSHYYIKRIIALPGESVEIIENSVYINGEKLQEDYETSKINDVGIVNEKIKLGSDEYFVLGDDRQNSEDSRNANVGNVKYSYIYGKAWFVISPKTHFGFVKE